MRCISHWLILPNLKKNLNIFWSQKGIFAKKITILFAFNMKLAAFSPLLKNFSILKKETMLGPYWNTAENNEA